MIKKNNKQQVQTTEQKCQALIQKSSVSKQNREDILEQIYSVINELEAIGQTIDEYEIVNEVLVQNDFEPLPTKLSSGQEKKLKLRASGRELKFADEAISKLNLDLRFSGVILDLRDFNWQAGDLTLAVKGRSSGLEVYVNSDVKIEDWIETRYSGVSYMIDGIVSDNLNNHDMVDSVHTITLEGDIRASGINFIYDHHGPYINEIGASKHHKPFSNEAKQKQKIHQRLAKLEANAERKRSKLNAKLNQLNNHSDD